MRLSPRDIEKLMLHHAGFLAQKRLARGLRLNYPESVALIASQLLEFIREGDSVAELMDRGRRLLGFADTLPGVADMLDEVQVEGTFPDGVKLVTVHHPICAERGDRALALYGSGLADAAPAGPVGSAEVTGGAAAPAPGEVWLAGGEIELNAGAEAIGIEVVNTGDRPVQVGSHYPFFESNAALVFDREAAFGRRLDIPSGTAVRFEPGEGKRVSLIPIGGARRVEGGNGLGTGAQGPGERAAALRRAVGAGFGHAPGGRP